MITAVVNPSNPDVQKWVALGAMHDADIAPGPKGRPRGHNAPATSTDPDIFDAFDSVITTEDLPEDFK
jgi:hypothetical protein